MTKCIRRVTCGLALCLTAFAISSCAVGETRAHVVIDATPEVRRSTASLELLVLAGPEQRLIDRRVWRVPQERELPTRLDLRPANAQDPGGFTLVVRAYGSPDARGELLVGRLLIAGYDPGRRVDYRVFLGVEPPELEDGGTSEGWLP